MLSGGMGPWKKQIFPEGGQLMVAVFGAKAVPTRSAAQENPEVTGEETAHGKVTPTHIIPKPCQAKLPTLSLDPTWPGKAFDCALTT